MENGGQGQFYRNVINHNHTMKTTDLAHGDDVVLVEEDVLYGNEAAAICDKIYQCCKFVVV